jgi:exopolysaccharide biosynthesis polyprenyl glycosylphosphotransferase
LDCLSAIAVWIAFYVFRRITIDLAADPEVSAIFVTPSYNLWLSAICYPAMAVAVHYLSGYYNMRTRRSRIVELFTTLFDSAIIAIITFFAIMLDDEVVSYSAYYRSFLVLFSFQFTITYTVRLIQTQRKFLRYKSGKIYFNTLIIGTGKTAAHITGVIDNKIRKYGQRIVGYISADNTNVVETKKILGSFDDIETVITNKNVKSVIIAVDGMDETMIFNLANRLLKQHVEIFFVPRLFEIVTGSVHMNDVDSEPFVSLTDQPMSAWQQSVKRAFDITASVVAGILLSPILIYIPLRIISESRGPIIYRQVRIGRGGKPFVMYKFRTMYNDAEHDGPRLTSLRDKRITPFGRFMRKYRLDELPQMLNIIKGDMSIVGPRPERKHYITLIEEKAPYYCLIYKIRPGLLSWGPIKIGYSDTVDKMVSRLNYDIVYMDNMSLLTDLKIIFYSIDVIVRGRGR